MAETTPESILDILLVNTQDVGGGAEKVAGTLFDGLRARGQQCSLAVGARQSRDPNVLLIPNRAAGRLWTAAWLALHDRLLARNQAIPGMRMLTHTAACLARPGKWLAGRRGREYFGYPGTWRLLDLPSRRPDLVHCHNLHGDYFDLRALPWLCHQVPTFITLHDTWLLTGHCAHSFDCGRWKNGCGQCGNLGIFQAQTTDATDRNWRTKQDIYGRSRLYLATPSQWLMSRAKESMLWPAVADARVINNGIELSVFKPAPRAEARTRLGLPADARIVLFAANGIRQNIWKDYQMMRTAVAKVSQSAKRLLFLALGDNSPGERIGSAEIRFVPYQKSPQAVAQYYQASDLYVHAAKVEVWGLTVTEALACGMPVVATAVGGIPEQILGLRTGGDDPFNTCGPDRASGILVGGGDADAMAAAVERLLSDDQLRMRMGENAAADAAARFGSDRQVDGYLQWYREVLAQAHATENR